MKFEELINHFGTQQKTANALNLAQSSIAEWKNTGIPLVRQYQIQVVTGGALQAIPVRKKANG